ncbi:hypothetical protein HY605_01060 [Candidatus Peregrinibacteria bacterium]|nr:hypothetical protein [Candidatus Peregrinibacteria bacterium]
MPWHTQSLSKLYKINGDKRYAEAIFILNDKLLELQDMDQDSEFFGRFYDPKTPQYGSPHSASDGVYTEGLVYAFEIAESLGDDEHMELYREAVLRALNYLISLQYQSDERAEFAYFSRLEGAIRYKIGDERIRIDTTQHTLDAYRKIGETGEIVL